MTIPALDDREALQEHFPYWELLREMVDQCIDFSLNLRQSGHPGGSRSKAHILLALMLGGIMRWDIRRPLQPLADRFILAAGHANPLVYSALAVLNEALRRRERRGGGGKYWRPEDTARQLILEDLLLLRRRSGLPGHAEMAGKTLFLKHNTGPSGHGAAAAAGQALALKLAGCSGVKVFVLDGEGGLTPGIVHETMNSAYGLGLDNLYFLIDWNDFGIDAFPVSRVVHGGPAEWFAAHGWRVLGTGEGMNWETVSSTLQDLAADRSPLRPKAAWFRTRKGRGYGIYDAASHGTPHPMNSPAFWEGRRAFMEKYGISFIGFEAPAPTDAVEQREQTRQNLEKVLSLFDLQPELVDYTAERLCEIAARVPERAAGVGGGERGGVRSKRAVGADGSERGGGRDPGSDPDLIDFTRYPAALFLPPGTRAANRQGLAAFGAYVNALCQSRYGRPLFIALSADLAESTNIAGFARDWQDLPGCGLYDRETNPRGALLPQEITELANAGICTGLAAVNLSSDPTARFEGFYAACSTYGAFSYLKYGPLRLFSQMVQDAPVRMGKILWIAGHSGPETADDSRTHFGIFAPGVTQLFPSGQIINLHPWEHNEVPVLLSAALMSDVPIIALHLTRPAIDIPDREALGLPVAAAAARGAYLLRPYDPGLPKMGTIFVQGTMTTVNLLELLPDLQRRRLNIQLVAAVSHELFMRQDEAFRREMVSEEEWERSTVISDGARVTMQPWLANRRAARLAMTPDWDDRWRTGGTIAEIMEEAHLSPEWLLHGIERFIEAVRG
ncbi:MAG TPA: transketolase [bacterium]|nr:transketolase [bacterium]HQJ65209.1 transketolase [bacterium]